MMRKSCSLLLAAAALLFSGLPAQGGEPDEISTEEFQSSPFARSFQEGNFESALEALQPLLKKYPSDPLLLRYRAITLVQLDRTQEASVQLQSLLNRDPNHIPTHYFLGLAYARSGETDKAAQEWKWVIEHSPLPQYRQWAETALSDLQKQISAAVPPRPRKWFLAGTAGWEWDSNVTLKPDDKALAAAGDQNADRFSLNLQIVRRLLQEHDRLLDFSYTTRHSFNDDGLDDLNFTSEEAGLAAGRGARFLNRPVWLGGRYDLAVGFLKDDLFSVAHGFTLSADARWSRRSRTVLANRLAWINFGPDGSNPPQTSRDGFYDDLEMTQYFYSADLRRYLFLSEAYNDARTRGGNFERRGLATRIGFHLPVRGRLEADVASGFLWNRYPRFSSLSSLDPERRRDTDWDFYVGLAYPVSPHLMGRMFYRFVKARNHNDFFEYDRHLTGVALYF